jgi:glutaredoxin
MPENDGPLIQMELLTRTEQRTVPNIFIGGEHIGGDSDLSEMYDSGSLMRLLEKFGGGAAEEMR